MRPDTPQHNRLVRVDVTASNFSLEAWARRVADAAALYGASRVVAEKNQGGDMIASNLRAVDANLPVELVHAGPSKAARAEPIALRFETGRARLAGHFPELEDQLCAQTWSGYQGPGSPDRADAMVWATELIEDTRDGRPLLPLRGLAACVRPLAEPVRALPLKDWFTQSRKAAKSPRTARTHALASDLLCRENDGKAPPAISDCD